MIFNAVGVSAYLYFLLGIDFGFNTVESTGTLASIVNWLVSHPYWAMVLSIGVGQAIAVTVFGLIFMRIWKGMEGTQYIVNREK